MDFSSRQPNDCAVVVMCALFNTDPLWTAIELAHSPKHGVKNDVINSFLVARGFAKKPIPRRGQESMTGVVRFASYSKSQTGHLALVIGGRVFDARYPNGLPIAEYRLNSHHNHITTYWGKI